MQNKILMVGLGLIGGSLALALRRNEECYVIGYDVDAHVVRTAKRIDVIDEMAYSLSRSVREVDYVIFATPVNTTKQLLQEATKWELRPSALILDTGSTKQEIVQLANELHLPFVGTHPMAGSHKSGIEAARAHLFENAYFILCPSKQSTAEHIQSVRELLKPSKAKVIEVSAEEHDQMTATVSHFPHLVAASLVHQLESQSKNPLTKQLAAGGFRDTTRIASSNPIMWRDITLQNKEQLLHQMDNWMQEMARIRDLVQAGDPTEIEAYFHSAKQQRDELPIHSQGALYSTFDLYIDVPDYPGVISEVTGLLALHRLSILNIRIIETREDLFGILVISFQTDEDRAKAMECIHQETRFETYIA